MSELSVEEGNLAGFRLQRLELWNWGTFDGPIQTLEVGGRWALIVGDNGSGKSTAIDALRTLLVPPRALNYNDASGDGRRTTSRDRSRKSYIRGAWASSSVLDSSAVSTQHLREPGSLSAIAAVFGDASRGRAVTVAQVLWLNDEQVAEIYAIAPGCRSIRELVEGRATSADIRRIARQSGWEIDDTFAAYAERMRSLLHIGGDKALEVFNRAIGMKEVGDIDAFVRQFMLPPADTYAFIKDTLLPHYKTLLDCWNAIARAEQQIELLSPIRAHAERLSEGEKAIAEWRRLQELIAPFTATLHLGVLTLRLDELRASYQAGEQQHSETRTRLTALNAERDQLMLAKGKNAAGARLAAIESELKIAHERRASAEERRTNLAPAIAALGARLALTDSSAFLAAKTEWRARQTEANTAASAQHERRGQLLSDQREKLAAVVAKRQELSSVEQNRVNIPYEFVALRRRIAQAVGVDASVLPFAGELMEVRDAFADWTGAIERLLRGFGLSLLVPDSHYRAATAFIDATFLGLRLTFHRVPARPSPAPPLAADRVPGRLRFRADHPLHVWVAGEVVRSFNHRCCDTTSDLEQADYGITRAGLIKNGNRHVKDDGRRIDDAGEWILGWSVEDKIAALRRRIAEYEAAANGLGKDANAALYAAERAAQIAAAARDLINVVDFADINPAQWSAEVIRLTRLRDELAQSSTELVAIQTRLEAIDVEVRVADEELTASNRVLGGLLDQINDLMKQKADRELELSDHPDYDHASSEASFVEIRSTLEGPTVGNRDKLADGLRQRLNRRIGAEQTKVSDARTEMAVRMNDFLNAFPGYRQLLRAEPSYADGFVSALERIEREDLPKHRDRFEHYLSENLVGTLAMLQHRLDDHQQDIDDRVRETNAALRGIDFTDQTYVELRLVPRPSPEISEFKRGLKECFEYGISPSADDHLLIFNRVRALLESFDAEPERTQRVIDIRNWLSAGIRERQRNGDAEVNFFAATTGKSGGQKAKLAFTILASALCAQYGLSAADPDAPQFRLVVIDEAFSRTDESNSTRAMRLFESLGFQLLIVGPFDAKAKLAVPFVDSIHLVTNPGGDSSHIHALTRADVERSDVPDVEAVQRDDATTRAVAAS